MARFSIRNLHAQTIPPAAEKLVRRAVPFASPAWRDPPGRRCVLGGAAKAKRRLAIWFFDEHGREQAIRHKLDRQLKPVRRALAGFCDWLSYGAIGRTLPTDSGSRSQD